MASGSIHCEILRRAAKIAGGEDKLAQHLDVKSKNMHEWVRGKATARAGIYIMALHILFPAQPQKQTQLVAGQRHERALFEPRVRRLVAMSRCVVDVA